MAAKDGFKTPSSVRKAVLLDITLNGSEVSKIHSAGNQMLETLGRSELDPRTTHRLAGNTDPHIITIHHDTFYELDLQIVSHLLKHKCQ